VGRGEWAAGVQLRRMYDAPSRSGSNPVGRDRARHRGMTLAHLSVAEVRTDATSRAALLMSIRDKLALALREET
jgi:hypothetical protein